MSIGQPFQQQTLFAEDTLASRSATPVDVTGPTTHDISGRCSPEPLAWFDHDSRCWKTLQATLVSGSDRFLAIWPRSGMTHDGIAYQLPPSAPLTDAIAYSLSLHGNMEWTPTATANQMAPSMLERNPGLRLWPTPISRDHKDGPAPVYRNGKIQTDTLGRAIGGSLNPAWVEWLMGFPIGWTDLDA